MAHIFIHTRSSHDRQNRIGRLDRDPTKTVAVQIFTKPQTISIKDLMLNITISVKTADQQAAIKRLPIKFVPDWIGL